MADAMAIFAAQRGLETGLQMKSAFDAQATAAIQASMLEMQMQEIESRTQMQIQNIYKQGEKVVSEQQAAFIKGGVELSGSAMSVISDTLNDAATAAYIRQRESDYELIGIAGQKGYYEQMASNENLWLNLTAAGINGVAGVAGDMYKYKQAHTKKIGGTEGISSGGTSSYSASYNAASGLSY
jgi:hypothetical protein